MENKDKQTIYVIGHINPDTDSICSAIAYAELKKLITGDDYKPMRAGQLNLETRFVLDYFDVTYPDYLSDLRTQVKDIEINELTGVHRLISIKKAWELMGKKKVVTLPIMKDKCQLEGLITVGDIATSYMDIYDSKILTKACTPVSNIVETLDGELIIGDKDVVFDKGKVLIAAANPDLMESYIQKDDIVILGNRYESQLCAIEMQARCIIVCDGADVSKTIRKLANDNDCIIIKSPHDTFTVARLINQSIPVDFFMKSEGIISFTDEDYIDDIKDVMARKSHRDFPIFDKKTGKCKGMISRRDLLKAERKKVILVDHNERTQAVDGLEETEILEIIDHHRLGSIETISPVFFRNQPLGCTATIIYQMYRENGVEIKKKIAGLLCSAILSDTLIFQSPTCTSVDKEAAQELAHIADIDIKKYAADMFAASSDLLNKTAEEIFYTDYKVFTQSEMTFCVGQITSMYREELDKINEKMMSYIQKKHDEVAFGMTLFMLTDISSKTTELLYAGQKAEEIIKRAFKLKKLPNRVILKGVVSRKKQLIPALMLAIQEDHM